MRFIGPILILYALPLFAATRVVPSRTAFNPSLHETVTYTVTIDEPGVLSARVLDRDTYVIKTLANAQRVTPGPITLTWDGTDAKGETVADEAWSVRLDFQSAKNSWTYFPASTPQTMTSISPDFYDRTSGVLRYTLAVPSRVHLQAGIADHTTTVKTAGAVMKTIVNRAPRPAGAVIEQWTGMDESGTIYVPALPQFVVSIAATPLPENSVISYGNKHLDFVQTALHRLGTPMLANAHTSHVHHQGLTALDDATPRLTATLSDATFDEHAKSWRTPNRVRFTIGLQGVTAEQFARQPARLVIYVDQRKVVDRPANDREVTLDMPNAREHIVAVNWASDYGPVAATAFRTHTAN